MRTTETVARLSGFAGRRAGTDAERRAAQWLCAELDTGGRAARLEPFWCRPNWALAHAWHAGLGLIGSLLTVSSPWLGGALVLVALLAVIADALIGVSPGRRLTPEHASQNVVSARAEDEHRIRLIVTANLDAGRAGIVYRTAPRATIAWLRRRSGRALTPGWMGWLVIDLAWLLVVAILRAGGAHGTPVGIVQLIGTVPLVVALASLLELGGAAISPAAGDDASGVAVALALVRALDAAPPRRLAVELVLQGAGDGTMTGLRSHLRARRPKLKAANAVVLGIAPCGAGRPHWWVSDGALIPLRYARRLRELSARVAESEAHLGVASRRGRGLTPALPARLAGLPAIAIGTLDARGVVPRSHTPADIPERLDPAAMDSALELGLALVDAIDADLAGTAERTARTAAGG